MPSKDKPESIKLWRAANRRAEVETVAREILHLCREKNYRFKDIAVLVRDLELYEPTIATVFDDYGLPYFLDCKKPVHHHPLVELVRSALEVVATDWAPEPVFRFIKTDLAGLTREEADLLENYILEHGLRGSTSWLQDKPWQYYRLLTLEEGPGREEPGKEEFLTKVNLARRKVTRFLGTFALSFKKHCIKGAVLPAEVTPILFNLIKQLHVPEILQSWQERDEREGKLALARGTARPGMVWWKLWNKWSSTWVVKNAPPGISTGFQFGLERLRMGQIPPALDQVLVGQIDRSRLPALKAVLS